MKTQSDFTTKYGVVQIIEDEQTLVARVNKSHIEFNTEFNPDDIECGEIVPDVSKLDQETVEIVEDYTPPDLFLEYRFKKI